MSPRLAVVGKHYVAEAIPHDTENRFKALAISEGIALPNTRSTNSAHFFDFHNCGGIITIKDPQVAYRLAILAREFQDNDRVGLLTHLLEMTTETDRLAASSVFWNKMRAITAKPASETSFRQYLDNYRFDMSPLFRDDPA